MSSIQSVWEREAEQLVAELTDSALEVILGYGAPAPSIDLELELWRGLHAAFREESLQRPGGDSWALRGAVLATLTDAAYQVALRNGTARPFVEVEIDLWNTFRRVGRQAKYSALFRRPRAGSARPEAAAAPAVGGRLVELRRPALAQSLRETGTTKLYPWKS